MISKQKMEGKDCMTDTYLYRVIDNQIVEYFLLICVGDDDCSLSSNISSSFVCYSICSCTDVERHLRVFNQEVFEISPVHMCAAVSTYKSVNHIIIYCSFKLSRDIEKNSGPINASKTICAPYSQGNVNFLVVMRESNVLL